MTSNNSTNSSSKKDSAVAVGSSDKTTTEKVVLSLKKRHRKEKLFKNSGLLAVAFGFFLVFTLVSDIIGKSLPAFSQHWIKLSIEYG